MKDDSSMQDNKQPIVHEALTESIEKKGRSILNVSPSNLFATTEALIKQSFRLALMSVEPGNSKPKSVIYTFLSLTDNVVIELVLKLDESLEIPSISSVSFSGNRFERLLHDLYGITPVDHHKLARLVKHDKWPDDYYPMVTSELPKLTNDSEPYSFQEVSGPGVYEIPVGPVHAGLIEPGHFRFSVVGEFVVSMKPRLWFVHKGIEKLFRDRDFDKGLELAMRISGDTAVGHSLSYCRAIEEATSTTVPEDSQLQRAVLLELERLYNHAGDIGMLCNDVAFGFAQAHASRIKEQLLRINKIVTGHRLLRGGVVPGGSRLLELPSDSELREIAADLVEVVNIALSNATIVDRFETTGYLSDDTCISLGTLGYVARASGVKIDARRSHDQLSIYTQEREHKHKVGKGDVMSRFLTRVNEFGESIAMIIDALAHVRAGAIGVEIKASKKGSTGVGIAEGWRGTIVHRVVLGSSGTIASLTPVDPSFFNWPALPVSLKDTIVPDFPLVNKSFNQSYAGNDL